jgi:hypothetical protein
MLKLRKQLVAAEFDRPLPFEYKYKVLKFVSNKIKFLCKQDLNFPL